MKKKKSAAPAAVADVTMLQRIEELEHCTTLTAQTVTIELLAIIARLLLRIAAKP